jgi:DNA-binding transcriptional MerR regulator
MAEWRIKEISDLTKTSIRMLRHYDKMGLLKPSYRSSNGYRCYNEQDLAKLQQIIALNYFGFKLSTMSMLTSKLNRKSSMSKVLIYGK